MPVVRTTARPLQLVVALAAALSLTACVSSRDDEFMELDPAQDSAWAFLSAKYDADGDGTITAEEYDRPGGDLARVDRNEDGVITVADYAGGPSGGREAQMMRMMRARGMAMTAFQDDEDPSDLKRTELVTAVARLDADASGALDAEEMAGVEPPDVSGQPPMVRRMMAGATPFAALAEVADADADGSLSTDELTTFFDSMDDGDAVWSMRRPKKAPQGPAQGEPAPDFTLTPTAGGDPVTLSSFAGDRPVALIFGSYT